MASDSSGRYVVQKRDGISGNPIPEDEPCIVIRGQDFLAPRMIDFYIREYLDGSTDVDTNVVVELLEHRRRVESWQSINWDKVKWADR